MARRILVAAALVVTAVTLTAARQGTGVPGKSDMNVQVEKLATLEFPWGLALLPDGRVLVTEKPGRLRIWAKGTLSGSVEGLPTVAWRGAQSEQGGLLDVAVDPDFANNSYIYLSFSEQAATAAQPDTRDPRFGPNADNTDTRVMGGAVMRAKLGNNTLTDAQVIWRQEPKTVGRGHFGHRLVFGRDGMLYITSGDRMRFDPAQSLSSNLGKVIRINRDGSIPKDNPFVGKPDARGEIWSYGHRNVLAAAVHPGTSQLWVVEMGPLGGDELNLIERGANYGWPIVSDGDNYDKSSIPDHQTRPELQAPLRTWTPVIAPSGALFYTGSMFPWRGQLIIGGLVSKGLVRLTLDGTTVKNEERTDLQRRIRDVLELADGSLLVLSDDKAGELLRLTSKPNQAR